MMLAFIILKVLRVFQIGFKRPLLSVQYLSL